MIIFATVALGSDRSSSGGRAPDGPSLSDMSGLRELDAGRTVWFEFKLNLISI